MGQSKSYFLYLWANPMDNQEDHNPSSEVNPSFESTYIRIFMGFKKGFIIRKFTKRKYLSKKGRKLNQFLTRLSTSIFERKHPSWCTITCLLFLKSVRSKSVTFRFTHSFTCVFRF